MMEDEDLKDISLLVNPKIVISSLIYKQKIETSLHLKNKIRYFQRMSLYYASGISNRRDLRKAGQLRFLFLNLLENNNKNDFSKNEYFQALAFTDVKRCRSKRAVLHLKQVSKYSTFGKNYTCILRRIDKGHPFGLELMSKYEANLISYLELMVLMHNSLFSVRMHSDALVVWSLFQMPKESISEFEYRRILLLLRASSLGNGIAQYLLGVEYLNDDFFDYNTLIANKLFELSSNTGFYKGLYVHGLNLVSGVDVDNCTGSNKNKELGLQLIRKAAYLGYDLALDYLRE